MDRFSFPASSSKTRRWAIFSASATASASVSRAWTPRSTTYPRPMLPTVSSPTRTLPPETRCTTARIRLRRLRTLEQVDDEGRGPGEISAAHGLPRVRMEVFAEARPPHEIEGLGGQLSRRVQPQRLQPTDEHPIHVHPGGPAPVLDGIESSL